MQKTAWQHPTDAQDRIDQLLYHAAPMADTILIRLLAWIEAWGVWLSWLAWATVFFGALAMFRATRRLRGRGLWAAAVVVTLLALTAHLADYIITLQRSPDLALEMNPIWRNIIARYGLAVAKWYGLTGKILVSILAGQMTAFYVGNRSRLYPKAEVGFAGFLIHMGERSAGWRDRAAALFTIFSFFFAGLTFFYFYIAYQNSLTDNAAALEHLPSVLVAVMSYVVLLCVAFVVFTYYGYRAEIRLDSHPVAQEQNPSDKGGHGPKKSVIPRLLLLRRWLPDLDRSQESSSLADKYRTN